MKCLPAIAAVVLSLASCGTFSGSLSSSGDFDPLRQPGSTTKLVSQGPTFSSGQFVLASMDNAAFFKNKPNGNSDADKLLKRNTSMKVISASGTYVKVELDSGEIGFVPALMLEDPNAAPQMAATGPGQYQVYPPLPMTGVGEPLPIIDPAGLPPEGAIPTIIDPDAPAVVEPLPPADSTPPVEPKADSVPLPPNGEEEKKKE